MELNHDHMNHMNQMDHMGHMDGHMDHNGHGIAFDTLSSDDKIIYFIYIFLNNFPIFRRDDRP